MTGPVVIRENKEIKQQCVQKDVCRKAGVLLRSSGTGFTDTDFFNTKKTKPY